MRVSELAQELNTTPAQVLDVLGSLGIEGLTHLSVVNDETVGRVKDIFQKRSRQVSGGEVSDIFRSVPPEAPPGQGVNALGLSEISEAAEESGPTDGQVAILACHKSGKSAYLYVLGTLEAKGKIGRWTMSALSEQFAKFFNQKKSQRNNWPPTDWRTLEDFLLFGVRNETASEEGVMELELRAFDTGGENFEIAFDPHRRESVSPDQEKSVERIKKKVLDANGYIILIDGELTDPEYAQRMEDLDGWVSPEDFLRNFYNTLANEGDALLQKPVAFVLTKGDLFYNEEFWSDEKALPRFAGAMARAVTFNLPEDYEAFRAKSVDEGREEAREFLKTRFTDAYMFSEKFPRRRYFVVSCWGFEPEYFAGDPPGGEPIPRRTMWKMSGEGQHTYTKVRNIQPVCVEEPLEWILDEVARDKPPVVEPPVPPTKAPHRFKRAINVLIVSALLMYWGGLYWGSYGIAELSLSQTGRDVVELFGLSRRDATSFCNRVCEFMYEPASRYCVYRRFCDFCGVNLKQDAFGPVLLKVCEKYRDMGEFDEARSVLRKAREAGLRKELRDEEEKRIDQAEKRSQEARDESGTEPPREPPPPKPSEPVRGVGQIHDAEGKEPAQPEASDRVPPGGGPYRVLAKRDMRTESAKRILYEIEVSGGTTKERALATARTALHGFLEREKADAWRILVMLQGSRLPFVGLDWAPRGDWERAQAGTPHTEFEEKEVRFVPIVERAGATPNR